MHFTGRSRELGLLRRILDSRHPQLVRVWGLPGAGKSEVVRRAARDYRCIFHRCPPLPDPAQRTTLARGVREALVDAGTALDAWIAHDAAETPTWRELFEGLLVCAAAVGHPLVLVLDDAHRLTEARARFTEPLRLAQVRAAQEGVAFHIVLIGPELTMTETAEPTAETGASPTQTALRIPPLPLRAAAPHLPGSRSADRVRAYGVFGGMPRVLAALDTSVTVGTNVRRLLLDESGALADAPLAWLERVVQTPSRYVAILATLAKGDADWGTLHAGVPDLTRSGQVAPYLKRLEDIGLIETRRSLDAGPRRRSTRYAITDPFVAFWFRFVFPWHLTETNEAIGPHYARAIRPGINDHMEEVLPRVCRQHMELDAIETLGAVARESGSLWNADTEIPVAGTLTSGAVYYGVSHWGKPSANASPLDRLDAQVRETRYGFGREGRLRLLFTGRPAQPWLRRDVARRHDAKLIDADALLGED